MRGCEAARWVIAPRDPLSETETAVATGLHPVVVAVLRNRGLTTTQQITDFLAPSVEELHDPGLLPDIEATVERLNQAVEQRERLLIHGDYDADGLTSTALLSQVLAKFGCEVQYYIPHRVHEQYGLSVPAIQRAAELGVSLLIAVDCGVTDYEAIAEARRAGVDVIVIDHHEPGPELPAGALVVDPKREDSCYPQQELAAVGLAFKVASALCHSRHVSEASLQRAFLDLVAVGTIADVVPLQGENRILAAAGLQVLQHTRSAGLRALLDICRVTKPVRAGDIAFRVAPRLNAVGRIGDGTDGLDLLLTDDPQEARRLALHLDSTNRQRQQMQDSAYSEALQLLSKQVDLKQDRIIVLSSPNWHIGVVGIVASKLLEQYYRPAIVLLEEKEQLRGSARSISGFDITAALRECSGSLIRFGGHALAAGLAVSPDNLDEFRRRINLVAAERIAPEQLVPQINIDAAIHLDEIDEQLLDELQRLEPYGHANPRPLFLSQEVEVLDSRSVGAQERHLKMYVRQKNRTVEVIGFGMGKQGKSIAAGDYLDLCYTPEINEYQGSRSLQLRLEALRPPQAAPGKADND